MSSDQIFPDLSSSFILFFQFLTSFLNFITTGFLFNISCPQITKSLSFILHMWPSFHGASVLQRRGKAVWINPAFFLFPFLSLPHHYHCSWKSSLLCSAFLFSLSSPVQLLFDHKFSNTVKLFYQRSPKHPNCQNGWLLLCPLSTSLTGSFWLYWPFMPAFSFLFPFCFSDTSPFCLPTEQPRLLHNQFRLFLFLSCPSKVQVFWGPILGPLLSLYSHLKSLFIK